jgi:hypothetical protein
MVNVSGEVLAQRVAIGGTYTVRGGSFTILTGIAPLTPGQPWTLDLGLSDAASVVGLTDVSGGVIIDNLEAGDVVHIHMARGQVVVNASCTGGTIVLTGISQLEDNSTGATVTHVALIHPEFIHETHKRLGLNKLDSITDTPSGIDSASGDIDIDRTGDGIASSTLTRQP